MSICCADLQNLRYFQHIQLVGGERGLYRQISWPFICTTSTISEWLHGGELLFLSGAGISCREESLLALMRESIAKNLAGMVILVGEQSIPEIPLSMIALADQAKLPLYQMPWDIKLIDVTQEISEIIMEQRAQAKKDQHFLEQLLFSGNVGRTPKDLFELMGAEGYRLCFFAVVEVLPENHPAILLDSVKSDIAYTLRHCEGNGGCALFTMRHLELVICFALANGATRVSTLDKRLEEAFQALQERNPDIRMRMGFGRVYDWEDNVQASFLEAKKALRVIAKGPKRQSVLHYCELGLYRLLFEVKNQEELQAYYQENLGPLLEADRKNSSNLVGTLRCYLYNNSNLLKTSQALFIHRNTLVYRINSIRELLGRDLDDSFVRHELFTSMVIGDFLTQ